MKKRTRNVDATRASTNKAVNAVLEIAETTTPSEIAETTTPSEIAETTTPSEIAETITPNAIELREQAKELREKAAAMLPLLEAIDVSKLDASKLKQLASEIAASEKLEKQAEKLEKQANAMAKVNAKALLEKAKASEIENNSRFVGICEEIAASEREFITLQAANEKMHQASIWSFNALTDTDFLIDREAHAETILTFESISKQLDDSNLLTSELAKQAQDKMRALYIANAEALASSQMKKARKAIGVKANEKMQAIVTSESESDQTEELLDEKAA